MSYRNENNLLIRKIKNGFSLFYRTAVKILNIQLVYFVIELCKLSFAGVLSKQKMDTNEITMVIERFNNSGNHIKRRRIIRSVYRKAGQENIVQEFRYLNIIKYLWNRRNAVLLDCDEIQIAYPYCIHVYLYLWQRILRLT